MKGPRQVIVKSSPRKGRLQLVFLALLSIGFIAASILASDESWYMRMLFGVSALFCAAIAIGGRRVLLGGEALLVANPSGLQHAKVGCIPWDDVRSIEPGSLGARPVLGIHVFDREKYHARLPRWLQVMATFPGRSPYPLLVIPPTILDRPPEQVNAELEEVAGQRFRQDQRLTGEESRSPSGSCPDGPRREAGIAVADVAVIRTTMPARSAEASSCNLWGP